MVTPASLCRLSIHLYYALFLYTSVHRDAALPIFQSHSLPASSSLEMRTRSTLSSFGWLGNCMLTANPTNTSLHMYFFFKEQNVGQMDTRQTCLSLCRFWRPCGHKMNDTCTSAHLLTLWFDIKSTFFFFSPPNAPLFCLPPFPCHAGYIKDCLCAVGAEQMDFCCRNFNIATASGSVTVTDCSTILMLWKDPAAVIRSCRVFVRPAPRSVAGKWACTVGAHGSSLVEAAALRQRRSPCHGCFNSAWAGN